MPQAPFNIVIAGLDEIKAKPWSVEERKARADEFLKRTGWTKEDFKRNYDYVKSHSESALSTAVGGFGAGATLNLMDEIVSGAVAGKEFLKGKPFKETYEREQGVQKAILEQQAKNQPTAKLVSELTGAIASPLARIGQGAASLWTRLASGAGSGAVAGAGAEEGTDRLTGAAMGAGLGTAGQGVAEGLGAAGRALASPAGDEALAAAQRLGVPITPGVAGGPAVRGAETMLRYTPGGAEVLEGATGRMQEGLEQAHEKIATKMAGGAPVAQTAGEAGGMAKDIAEKTSRSVNKHVNRMLDNVTKTVGPDTPVDLKPLEALQQHMLDEVAKAPQSGADKYSKPLAYINRILNDAQNTGGMPFQTFRRQRSDLGKALYDKQAKADLGYTPGIDTEMEKIHGAMRDSLMNTAEAVSPGAGARMKAFDRFVTNYRAGDPQYAAPAETLQKIVDSGTDERAWNLLTKGSPKELEQLRMLTNRFGEGAWDAVAASVWNTMGRSGTGTKGAAEAFDMNTFLKNWRALPDTKKRQIFRGTKQQAVVGEMNDLVKLVDEAQRSTRAGAAPAARYSIVLALLGAAGAGVTAATGNRDPASIAAGTAGGLALPAISAAALTRPKTLRALNAMGRWRNKQTLSTAFSQFATTLDEDDKENLKRWMAEQRNTP